MWSGWFFTNEWKSASLEKSTNSGLRVMGRGTCRRRKLFRFQRWDIVISDSRFRHDDGPSCNNENGFNGILGQTKSVYADVMCLFLLAGDGFVRKNYKQRAKLRMVGHRVKIFPGAWNIFMLFHDNVSAHLHEVSSSTHGLPFSWIEMSEVDGFSFKHRFGEPVKFWPVAFIVLNTAFLYVVYLFFHLITLLKTSSSFVFGVVETVVLLFWRSSSSCPTSGVWSFIQAKFRMMWSGSIIRTKRTRFRKKTGWWKTWWKGRSTGGSVLASGVLRTSRTVVIIVEFAAPVSLKWTITVRGFTIAWDFGITSTSFFWFCTRNSTLASAYHPNSASPIRFNKILYSGVITPHSYLWGHCHCHCHYQIHSSTTRHRERQHSSRNLQTDYFWSFHLGSISDWMSIIQHVPNSAGRPVSAQVIVSPLIPSTTHFAP